jgi:hypothetical protein
MNGAGAAVVCFTNGNTGDLYAATAAANSNEWSRVGPLRNVSCDDVGIDSRGNALVVGQDASGQLTADRIVGGQLRSETIDQTGKDEPSVALSSGGNALALARIDAGGSFAAAAWRKADIAQEGAWEKLGRVDEGARGAAENSEYARAALDGAGTGVLTFRVNNPATNTARLYFAPVDARAAAPVVAPRKLADVAVGQEAIPNVDASGNPIVAREGTGSNGKALPFVYVFANGSPGQALPLVPESGDDVDLVNVPSFAADTSGNFLALLRRASGPVRVVAAFGDFVPPTLKPQASPQRPRLAQLVTLRSRATDSFASVPPGSVEWRFARGSVEGAAVRHSETISVRFLRAVPAVVRVSATDRAGNRAEQTLTLQVAPARAVLRASPARRRRGGTVTFTGAGFLPRRAVALLIGRSRAHAFKFATARGTARGTFRKRYRLSARAAPGVYVVLACQLQCRIKASARLRIA